MSLAVAEAARRSQHDLSSLHSVMSAASSVPASLWHDLQDVLGAEQMVTAYGMSETSAATTFTRVGGPVEDLEHTVGWPKAVGIRPPNGLRAERGLFFTATTPGETCRVAQGL